MFCTKCGNSVSKHLKYCNSCGTRLAGEVEDKDGTPGKMLDNVLTTIFMIVMFGLGIMVGLVAVLLANNVRTELVAVIIVAYLATIFGINVALVRQVPKLIDARLKASGLYDPDGRPLELERHTTAQLAEPREPPASVVDHTTRTLEKTPVSR